MNTRWRTVDIVVASILAVVFGVIFWAWYLLWSGPLDVALASFPPGKAILYGMWLVPGVLAGLIIRKPGAALYTEFLAAVISVILGNAWGVYILWYGLAQGIGAEIGFAAYRYRKFGWPQALLGAALSGVAAALLDLYNYYADWSGGWQTVYSVLVILSTLAFAGAGSVYLTRALSGTGVLDRFPSGRTRELV